MRFPRRYERVRCQQGQRRKKRRRPRPENGFVLFRLCAQHNVGGPLLCRRQWRRPIQIGYCGPSAQSAGTLDLSVLFASPYIIQHSLYVLKWFEFRNTAERTIHAHRLAGILSSNFHGTINTVQVSVVHFVFDRHCVSYAFENNRRLFRTKET